MKQIDELRSSTGTLIGQKIANPPLKLLLGDFMKVELKRTLWRWQVVPSLSEPLLWRDEGLCASVREVTLSHPCRWNNFRNLWIKAHVHLGGKELRECLSNRNKHKIHLTPRRTKRQKKRKTWWWYSSVRDILGPIKTRIYSWCIFFLIFSTLIYKLTHKVCVHSLIRKL